MSTLRRHFAYLRRILRFLSKGDIVPFNEQLNFNHSDVGHARPDVQRDNFDDLFEMANVAPDGQRPDFSIE
jgi:hypothetical protein